MKILFLDDDKERHAAIDDAAVCHDVWHVYGFHKFCETLREHGPFDLVFFDHDLGDFGDGDSYSTGYATHEYTGRDAAVVAAKEIATRTTAVVHSWNPDGAKDIVAILNRNPAITCVRAAFAGNEWRSVMQGLA